MALPNLSNLPRLKKNLPLIVAVATGLLAVVMINIYIQQQRADLERKLEEEERRKTTVVVASQDIPAGSSLTQGMLAEKKMRKDELPPYAASSISRVIDKITPVEIPKGEVILLNKLSSPLPEEVALSAVVPPGKRAITIPVDNIFSVGSMIRPGDHVDLLGVLTLPEAASIDKKESAPLTILPLFQDVLVLAFGRDIAGGRKATRGGSAGGTITLALSPLEANIIAFIEEQGRIRLVLRSSKDKEIHPTGPTDWNRVLEVFKLQREAVKETPKRKVEIYHGLKKEVRILE